MVEVGPLKARSSKIVTFTLPKGVSSDGPITFGYDEFWHFSPKSEGSQLKSFRPTQYQDLLFKEIAEDEAKQLKSMVNSKKIARCSVDSDTKPKTQIVLRCDDPYRIRLLKPTWEDQVGIHQQPWGN